MNGHFFSYCKNNLSLSLSFLQVKVPIPVEVFLVRNSKKKFQGATQHVHIVSTDEGVSNHFGRCGRRHVGMFRSLSYLKANWLARQ